MIKQYGNYQYKVFPYVNEWLYVIYEPGEEPSDLSIMIESDEWFETKQEAEFAAIGQIDILKEGE